MWGTRGLSAFAYINRLSKREVDVDDTDTGVSRVCFGISNLQVDRSFDSEVHRLGVVRGPAHRLEEQMRGLKWVTCLPHKVSSRFCSTADLWFLNVSLRAVQLGQIKLNLGLVLQSNERIRRTAVSAAAADVRALSAPRTATAPPLDPVSTEAKSSTANRRPSTVGDFRLKQTEAEKLRCFGAHLSVFQRARSRWRSAERWRKGPNEPLKVADVNMLKRISFASWLSPWRPGQSKRASSMSKKLKPSRQWSWNQKIYVFAWKIMKTFHYVSQRVVGAMISNFQSKSYWFLIERLVYFKIFHTFPNVSDNKSSGHFKKCRSYPPPAITHSST